MKKFVALILALSLFLVGCSQKAVDSEVNNIKSEVDSEIDDENDTENKTQNDDDEIGEIEDEKLQFSSLADDSLLQHVEDSVYSELEDLLASEDYIIEDVSATYVSKEYLDELAYNSQANIYFGYTLADIDAQFDGEKYVFTCNDDGETVISKYELYDDTYDQIVRNVAIGTGVILVCVTVSVASGGLGAPAVSAVFAASAKTGIEFAASSAVISGAAAAIVTGVQTHDVETTFKEAALTASEGFKWGAITGVVTGGVQETVSLYKASKAIPTPRQSEEFALSKYGGEEQVSFLGGEEVNMNTPGATRPDVVIKNADGTVEAIEVKNYNLANKSNRNGLYRELERQIKQRVEDLPAGSTQRIVLDTRNRKYAADVVPNVINNIRNRLQDIYPNIPIDVL